MILPPRAPYAEDPTKSLGRKVSEPESRTRTPFARDRDRIILTVIDPGVGMSASDLQQAFVRYAWLESRSTDTAGAEHTARQIIGRDELEDYGADGQMKYVTLYLRGDGPLAEVHAIALKG